MVADASISSASNATNNLARRKRHIAAVRAGDAEVADAWLYVFIANQTRNGIENCRSKCYPQRNVRPNLPALQTVRKIDIDRADRTSPAHTGTDALINHFLS